MKRTELESLESEIRHQKRALHALARGMPKNGLKLSKKSKISTMKKGKIRLEALEKKGLKSIKELEFQKCEQNLEELKLRRKQLKRIVELLHDQQELRAANEFLQYLDGEIKAALKDMRRLDRKSIFSLLIDSKLAITKFKHSITKFMRFVFISHLKKLKNFFKNDELTKKTVLKKRKQRKERRKKRIEKENAKYFKKRKNKSRVKAKAHEFLDSVKDSATILKSKHIKAIKNLDQALDEFIKDIRKTPTKFARFFVKKKRVIKIYPHPKLSVKEIELIKHQIKRDLVVQVLTLKRAGKSYSTIFNKIVLQGYPDYLVKNCLDLVYKIKEPKDKVFTKTDILFEVKAKNGKQR